MAEHAIERRLIGGVWQTVDVEEDTGGGSPDLAAVLAEGGDPEDNPITGPVTINLAGQPNIAGLLVIDHNGRPILGISGAGIGEPTLGGVPTLHSDEHGVTVSLDGLSQGFLVMARTGDVPFKVAATGAVTIAPPSDSSDSPFTLFDKTGLRLIEAIPNGNVYLGGANSRISPDGVFMTSVHTAPADGAINPGECAIWFDQTDGAAKLMIKAKTEDGTIAVGEVALT